MTTELTQSAIKLLFIILLALIVTQFIGVELSTVAHKIAKVVQGAGD